SDVRESVAWFEQRVWERRLLWSDQGERRTRLCLSLLRLCRDRSWSQGPGGRARLEHLGVLVSGPGATRWRRCACPRFGGLDVTMAPTDKAWSVREFGYAIRTVAALGSDATDNEATWPSNPYETGRIDPRRPVRRVAKLAQGPRPADR